MSEGSGEVNQNEELKISGAIKEPLNQSETEKPEENQKEAQDLLNPLSKTLMTEANNLIVPQNEENDENENQSENKEIESENPNVQPTNEEKENNNNEQEIVEKNESDEIKNEETNETNENQPDQQNTEEEQEGQNPSEQNDEKHEQEEEKPNEEQQNGAVEHNEEEAKEEQKEDEKDFEEEAKEEQTNNGKEDEKDFEEETKTEPENNGEEAEANDKNSDRENENDFENEQEKEGNDFENEHEKEGNDFENEHENEFNENENEDNKEPENEENREEPQNEEGMSVIDNVRFGTPNAGKRIDVSTLPLLETPIEIETSCKRQIERFKKRGKFADPSVIPQVLQYLQREKANQVTKSQYKDAFNTDELIKKIVQYSQTLQKNEAKDAKTGALESRINELDREIKDTQKEAEKRINDIKEKHEKQVTKVQQLQKEELQRLQDTWNDPAYLRRYEKPSAKLLQLSSVEHSLVSQGDFANADRIKNEIDELEIKESQEAQERATQEMLSQQQKMLAKHERENKLLDQQLETQIERVNILTDSKTKTIEDRKSRVQKQLEVYKEDTKLPPLKPKEKTETVITPRTQMRMIICKQSMRNPKISVKPLGALPTKKKRNSKLRETI